MFHISIFWLDQAGGTLPCPPALPADLGLIGSVTGAASAYDEVLLDPSGEGIMGHRLGEVAVAAAGLAGDDDAQLGHSSPASHARPNAAAPTATRLAMTM